VAAQLGREPLVPFTVVARCGPGHPLVIRNHPVDAKGNPFPTLYWLTCPETIRAVARLESEGWIKRLEAEAEVDPDLRTGLRRAHEEYAAERGALVAGSEQRGGVGGAARGVKCLHAHYAYYVGGGPDPIGKWVADRLKESDQLHYEKPSRRLGTIDLGTNSIRLLVARFTHGEADLQDLARDMVITRIGQGVDQTHRLAPAALRRTLDVLERYCRRARALDVERIHLAATSAVRDAANRDDLANEVQRLTGEPMEVLSGEEEAERSFVGATHGLAEAADVPGPYLVLDIGGGSTEFVLGQDGPALARSTNMGSVRLTERFVHTDPPSYEELDALEAEITDILAGVEDHVAVHDARTLVAVAGTATTMQAIAMGLPEYDPEQLHRTRLSRLDADRVFRLLADMTVEERREIPVMAPGREDVIPAGAAILTSVMHRWGFTEALVSETDILDGLAYAMVEGAPGSVG
jgi:exopolyphosphatase/guanosine-5'-triphosphate,3'-diphosphate pyrophosphatase